MDGSSMRMVGHMCLALLSLIKSNAGLHRIVF